MRTQVKRINTQNVCVEIRKPMRKTTQTTFNRKVKHFEIIMNRFFAWFFTAITAASVTAVFFGAWWHIWTACFTALTAIVLFDEVKQAKNAN